MSRIVVDKDLSVESIVKKMQTGKVMSYVRSDNTNYTGSNQPRIIFRFPRELISLKDSYLFFNLVSTGAGGGGTYVRCSNPVTSIFRQINIYFGSQSVCTVDNANILSAIHLLGKEEGWRNSVGLLQYGIDSAANRNAAAAGKDYCVQLNDICRLLETPLLPLNETSSEFRLELVLENPNRCLETDYATYNYTVSNAQYWYSSFPDVPDAYKAELRKHLDAGMRIGYETHNNYLQSDVVGSSFRITLPYKFKCWSGMYYVHRVLSTASSPTTNDKFSAGFLADSFATGRAKINGVYLPSRDYISGVYQAYQFYTQTVGCPCGEMPVFAAINYASTTFILGLDFSQDHRSVLKDDLSHDMSGIDTQVGSSTSVLELTWSAPIAAAREAQMFARTFNIITIYSGGKIVWEE